MMLFAFAFFILFWTNIAFNLFSQFSPSLKFFLKTAELLLCFFGTTREPFANFFINPLNCRLFFFWLFFLKSDGQSYICFYG